MDILDSLEKKYEIKLPKKYRDWFAEGGPKQDEFIGTDMDVPYLPNLKEWAEEFLVDSKYKYSLPATCFVFAMHQGYQFMYFLCDGSEDPEIWYYTEGDKEPCVKWNSFSEFVANRHE